MIIPISHEHDTVRRLPWITFIIMASCLIIHIFISIEVNKASKEAERTAREFVEYYLTHPYLELDQETKKIIFGGRSPERIDALLDIYRREDSRSSHPSQEEEQEKLDQLSQKLKTALNNFPYRKWGFIPAKKTFLSLLTHMFIHSGWLHLLGNLLFLYLAGPFIEDVWGRPIYTAFYVIAGMLAALMYAQYYPNFTGPLIGASGAIAGVMGAFLIRYWKIRIKFFYIFLFLIRGTFTAPAWLMLPLWLLLEIFNAKVIDSINPQGGGVAHWVHIWGFIFGVVVASGIKKFKVEEKFVSPKIEAKIQYKDDGFETLVKAIQVKNAGRVDEAYALLLDSERKNPKRNDVLEALWECGIELGKVAESARFITSLIEREIRNNQMDQALYHFFDLKAKMPQASINLTYKFQIMKYLTEHKDSEHAKELALELLEEVDLNSPPALLQNFAHTALELSPSIAKNIIELCLQHPEIPTDQKDKLRRKLDGFQ